MQSNEFLFIVSRALCVVHSLRGQDLEERAYVAVDDLYHAIEAKVFCVGELLVYALALEPLNEWSCLVVIYGKALLDGLLIVVGAAFECSTTQ